MKDKEAILQKVRWYNQQKALRIDKAIESMRLQYSIEFATEDDLDFELMDFFYDGMLTTILRDARERAERQGYGAGYSWGKRYLYHYAGEGALAGYGKHEALSTSKAYDIVRGRLEKVCADASTGRPASLPWE